MTTSHEELDQLLVNLKLKRMRAVIGRELERAATEGSAADEVIVRLLREQWLYQQERSLAYRMDIAKIPERWEIGTYPFDRQPSVNKAQVQQLAHLDFVASASNVVLIGPTGVGKTGLATGLLLVALRNGHSGRFIKAQDLLDEMFSSLADRSTKRMLDSLARLDVLLIDELGYLAVRTEQANIFFRLMDMRHTKHKPTIITTNLEYDAWSRLFGAPEMTKPLLDRLRQRCVTIRIDGPSLRDQTG